MRYRTCPTCITYAEGRQRVLAQPLADKAAREGTSGETALDTYMTGVHERHLSGLSLEVDRG